MTFGQTFGEVKKGNIRKWSKYNSNISDIPDILMKSAGSNVSVGVSSLFDDINKIKNKVEPFRVFFYNDYVSFLEKITKLENKIQKRYEKMKKDKMDNKIVLTLEVEDPGFDISIITEISKLEQEVNEFYIGKYNFSLINYKLEKVIEGLEKLYPYVVARPNDKSLQKQVSSAKQKVEEIALLKNELTFTNDVIKQEEMEEYFYHALYILSKVDFRISFYESFKNIQKSHLLKFLLDDLKSIEKVIEKNMKSSKYYFSIRLRLTKLLTMNKSDFGKEQWQEFLELEKKVMELSTLHKSN